MTKEQLDALGRAVVRSGSLDAEELDRIASRPGLYDGILTKIATGSGRGAKRSVWRLWVPALGSAAFVAIVSVVLAGYFGRGPAPSSTARIIYSVEEDRSSFKRSVTPTVKAPEPTLSEPLRPEPAVYSRPVEKRPEPKPRQRKPDDRLLPEADFHPIGFTANLEDALLDGRVVRVEMPRAALFSLGVDIPLENGTKAVKADLLVGSDGTPRGIRFVE